MCVIIHQKYTLYFNCLGNLPSVSGSWRKTSRQSTKLVPLKGSPPIPESERETVRVCVCVCVCVRESESISTSTKWTMTVAVLTNTERLSQANISGLPDSFIGQCTRSRHNSYLRKKRQFTLKSATIQSNVTTPTPSHTHYIHQSPTNVSWLVNVSWHDTNLALAGLSKTEQAHRLNQFVMWLCTRTS